MVHENRPYSFSWPIFLVFYQRSHINGNQLVDLVDRALQYFFRVGRNVDVQRRIFLRGLAAIRIPHPFGSY